MYIYSNKKFLYSVNVYVFIPMVLSLWLKMGMHEDRIFE